MTEFSPSVLALMATTVLATCGLSLLAIDLVNLYLLVQWTSDISDQQLKAYYSSHRSYYNFFYYCTCREKCLRKKMQS